MSSGAGAGERGPLVTTSDEAFHELFTRYVGNPILTAQDWPYLANTVFNPGAVRLKDGQTLLLVRVIAEASRT